MSRRRPRRTAATETNAQVMAPDSITAAAMILNVENARDLVISPLEWQREAWAFYRTIGEMRFAIGTWLAAAASRVRITAAVKHIGDDDPVPVTEGPVAEIVASLAGGIGGQAAMLKRMIVQVSVPGDSYLVGEDSSGMGDLESMTWRVYSSDEIRIKNRGRSNVTDGGAEQLTYDVMVQRNKWRALEPESMVVRCWDPDEQFSYLATSVAQAALPILREIDFYNRYIIAVLTSRLASNGLLLIPTEVTFPVRPQYKDREDPFVAELLDMGTRAIKNPGSAGAALPSIIKVPAQYIEHFKHLIFATEIGKEVLGNREKAFERLATTLNVPAEVLTGMSKMNHWGQWQMEESAVKIYISPPIEIIVNCLTTGFLRPLLSAANLPLQDEKGGDYIVWYDASALTQQPDKTEPALNLSDRGEISGEALRRATGFKEEDRPSDDEFKDIALRRIALAGGADAMRALAALTGDDSLLPPAPVPVDQAPGADVAGHDTSPGSTPTPAPGNQPQAPAPAVKEAPKTRPAAVVPVTLVDEPDTKWPEFMGQPMTVTVDA